MKKKEVQEKIYSYFKKVNPKLKKLNQEDDYFATGYIDSLDAIEMISFIEENFNIELSSEDMENPNFKIVKGLIELIYLKVKKK